MKSSRPIPVFAINLKKRDDRRKHIVDTFTNRSEFELTVVDAVEEENGRMGLWKTIKKIVEGLKGSNYDFAIICEDDHYFTDSYTVEILKDSIKKCQRLKAEALLGGVSWFQGFVPYSENVCWIERFTGLQFFVVFKDLYDKILNTNFTEQDAADLKIYEISNKIYLIHPFISMQREFGYSDTTERNNEEGIVTKHFAKTSEDIVTMAKLSNMYADKRAQEEKRNFPKELRECKLPVLDLEKLQNNENVTDVFTQDRNLSKRIIYLNGSFKQDEAITLNYIIKTLAKSENEFFIITNNFQGLNTESEIDYLLSNIWEAMLESADCLCAGCGDFGQSFPITINRFWISSFSQSSLLVIFSSYYDRILEVSEDFTFQNVDYLISKNTIYKMLLYPFIPISEMSNEASTTKNKKSELKGRRISEATKYLRASIKENIWL